MQTESQEEFTGSRTGSDPNTNHQMAAPYRQQAPKLAASQLSPFRLLVTIIIAIFIAEVVAMVVVYALGTLPYIQLTLIDATTMTVLIFPVLYLLSFQPLLRYIEKSRQAEAALIHSLELQERFFDSIDTLIAYMDRNFNIVRVNEAFARADGRQPEYFINKNYFNLFPHPENKATFQRVVETGNGYSANERPFEYPEHPERGILYLNWSLLPVRGINGDVEGVVLSQIDVTERKRAEEKNRQLSRIVEQTADTVVVTDCDGVIEYVNPAFEKMTGYTMEDALEKTPSVLKSGVYDAQFYKELWKTILDGEVFQSEIANRKKDGQLFYEEKTITPLRDERGDITHFVATGKDISERKKAEEQLRRAYDDLELRVHARTEELRIANSELEEEIIERKRVENMLQQQAEELEMQAEELQAQHKNLVAANEKLTQIRLDLDHAQEVGQIGSWRLDVRRNILTWSEENHRIFGVPVGTPLTYETFLSIVHPDDREYVDTQWNAALAGAPYDIEHRLLVSGQVKWVREKAFLEFNENGILSGAFGIAQDITERVETEKAIKESEEKYRSLFDNMNEGFGLHEMIFDEAGKPYDYRFIELNQAFEQLTGISREKALGRTVKDMIPEIEAYWIDTYGRVVLTGQPIHFENYSAPLGKWYETYCYSPKKNQFAVVFFDITERRQAEMEVQRAAEELRVANQELTRFNNLMVGRELRMIELKKEVNELCTRTNQPVRYPLDFEREQA